MICAQIPRRSARTEEWYMGFFVAYLVGAVIAGAYYVDVTPDPTYWQTCVIMFSAFFVVASLPSYAGALISGKKYFVFLALYWSLRATFWAIMVYALLMLTPAFGAFFDSIGYSGRLGCLVGALVGCSTITYLAVSLLNKYNLLK